MTFHRNSLKLAGLYLAVIMAISLFFSVSLYNLSLRELDRGLRGPAPRSVMTALPDYNEVFRQQIEAERSRQFEQARSNVLETLIITNTIIFVGAGFLSYYLAYRTLRPIEEAQEAQARFTADASHELRTPIAAMQTETEVALMDPALTLSAAKNQLKSNLEELAKLTNLTEGLLGLAQYEHMALETVPVNLQHVLVMAEERVRVAAVDKQIYIHLPAKVTGVVQGNEQLLTEVVVIVLDNAIKYSGKKTKVTITVRHTAKHAAIVIADQGQGIRVTDLPHIFDRFYRADTARNKRTAEGYGLGLSLAQRIIALHHGTITAISKPGKGSTFTITVPLA